MTETPGPKEEQIISQFDALIIALKKALKRDEEAGLAVPPTPAIDEYIEKKKREAGSPPPEERE